MLCTSSSLMIVATHMMYTPAHAVMCTPARARLAQDKDTVAYVVSLTDKSNGYLYLPADGGQGLGPAGEGTGQVVGGLDESDVLDLVEQRCAASAPVVSEQNRMSPNQVRQRCAAN